MTEHTPVLIVGAGPVGLALAGDLGWRGIACTLIEKTDGAIEQPEHGHRRPAHHGVLPALGHRRLGARRALPRRLSAGLHLRHGARTATSSGASGFPGRAHEKCPPQSPQKRERVPQDMFDPILQRFVRSLPAGAACARRPSCSSFEETADGVLATVRDKLTGATRTISAGLPRRHRRRRQPGARARSASP